MADQSLPLDQNHSIDWHQLLKQKPREIVLSGERISKQINKDNGLNELLFKLDSLNFLEITNAFNLTKIDINISQLGNLTTLVLQNNKLRTVPEELGHLVKLKCLNLSRNEIDYLPPSLFDNLKVLQTLNLEQNKLITLPNMSKLSSLITLKCGSNELIEFPNSICDKIQIDHCRSFQSVSIYEGGAVHLAELDVSHNKIQILPITIGRLVALKTLDLSFNQIKSIPHQLADCRKLKNANLKENPIKDRRLYKLIEQCPTKKILDYIRVDSSDESIKNKADEDKDSRNKSDNNEPEFTIKIQHSIKEKFFVIVSQVIKNERKIVACIIHQVNLSNPKVLKKILTLQTKLHEGICENRLKATIATHDFSKLQPPSERSYASKATYVKPLANKSETEQSRTVYFDGRVPTKIRLTPLGRSEEMTAMDLYRLLNDEADQYRKEKKRNTISGIHKYIHLLKGKQLYPVLLDSRDTVLSLPPLTNAEYSKIGPNTTSIFVEVSGESVPTCRMVINELINLFLTATVVETDGSIIKLFPNDEMIIEPVIVELAETHELLVKYPSKIDLQFDHVRVLYE